MICFTYVLPELVKQKSQVSQLGFKLLKISYVPPGGIEPPLPKELDFGIQRVYQFRHRGRGTFAIFLRLRIATSIPEGIPHKAAGRVYQFRHRGRGTFTMSPSKSIAFSFFPKEIRTRSAKHQKKVSAKKWETIAFKVAPY